MPFRNTLCLIKIHTLVEIPCRPRRWELPIAKWRWDQEEGIQKCGCDKGLMHRMEDILAGKDAFFPINS